MSNHRVGLALGSVGRRRRVRCCRRRLCYCWFVHFNFFS